MPSLARFFLKSTSFALASLVLSLRPRYSLALLTLFVLATQNEIPEIPAALTACVKMETLNFGENKLTSLPEDLIGQFTELRELYLYRNKLESLPGDIGTLGSLEKLSISKNNLKALPENVGELASLQEL
jgi:Leucine-rich repeat (LRR) protein